MTMTRSSRTRKPQFRLSWRKMRRRRARKPQLRQSESRLRLSRAACTSGKSSRSALTCAGGCREFTRSFFGWAQLARERAPARAAARARALEPQLRSGTQRPRPRARSGEPPLQRRFIRSCGFLRGTPLKVHPQLRIPEGSDAHRARGSLRRERVGRQPPTKKEKINEKESPPL